MALRGSNGIPPRCPIVECVVRAPLALALISLESRQCTVGVLLEDFLRENR